MADKRINALANTAPSTASDDFIAVDGTTNGTRKLNAFSPTFGGNVVVTGTLTANSAITGPTLIPGLNTAAHYFTAYGASASWPFRISTIYDADYVDHYLTLNGTLTGSRATPTFTGAAAGGAFLRANGFTSTLSVGTFGAGAGAAINTVANFNPTNVTIPLTTASTSTSSGALVVSGGVGVGGNLSIGGDVLIDKSAIEVLLKRGANTNDGLIKFQTGILGDFAIGNRGTSDSDLHIYNYGTAADAVKIAKSDSLATFAAAIRTAAPSGGTAANWKLGTVATVSPTSPNRTIEVDIGGTIYYIHAKTTNN